MRCSMSNLRAIYQTLIDNQQITEDFAQIMVLEELQKIYDALVENHRFKYIFLKKINKILPFLTQQSNKGLYIWGTVGRGKTLLMDLFFEVAPIRKKLRLHFHHFMQRIHKGLGKHRNLENPLIMVANELLKEAELLCFDEFFVTDIADAMLLKGLFEQLFKHGMIVVTTSNIAPKDLYKNGLQWRRFQPAINLIETHMKVMHIASLEDYRMRALSHVGIYHYQSDDQKIETFEKAFRQLAPCRIKATQSIRLFGRDIPTVLLSNDVVWFEFSAICEGPRGVADYIELAKSFHTVFLSNIPCFTNKDEDKARRFMALIDEFYDHRVKLIMTAYAPIDRLYTGQNLKFGFVRTISRLTEMQSSEYLMQSHKA